MKMKEQMVLGKSLRDWDWLSVVVGVVKIQYKILLFSFWEREIHLFLW